MIQLLLNFQRQKMYSKQRTSQDHKAEDGTSRKTIYRLWAIATACSDIACKKATTLPVGPP